MRSIYRKIEALQSLYQSLEINFPLPTMSGWAASPDFLQLIVLELLRSKAKLVYELGSGTSTIILGYALKKIGGRLISFEHDDMYFQQTQKYLNEHALERVVKLVYAPLKEMKVEDEYFKWYDISPVDIQNDINIIVVDGPPGSIQPNSRYPAIPKLYPHLASDSIVFLDDGKRKEEETIANLWVTKYPEFSSELIN